MTRSRGGLLVLGLLLAAGCASSATGGSPATTAVVAPSTAGPAALPPAASPAASTPASVTPTSAPSASAAPPSTAAAASAGADVIPWLDAPAPVVYATPADQPTTHPVLHPACTAKDLSASTPGWGVGMGRADQRITLTNFSDRPCSLSGLPLGFRDTTRSGSVVDVAVTDGGFGQNLDAVANLLPGQSGYTDLLTSDYCTGFQHPLPVASFALELPDHSQLPVVDRSKLAAPPSGCDISASSFGTTHVPVPEPTYPLDHLKVTLQLPAEVDAGRTFDFTVTLANPTSTAVSLSPCPSYHEVWKPGRGTPPMRSYFLNCRGHSSIAAGQSLTFAMQMVAPVRALTDYFSWWLEVSNDAEAGAMLPVVG